MTTKTTKKELLAYLPNEAPPLEIPPDPCSPGVEPREFCRDLDGEERDKVYVSAAQLGPDSALVCRPR